jgi:hypothetical protein
LAEPTTAADDEAANVSVLDPEPGEGRLAVENAAVTPAGKPVAESVTADLNPPVGDTVNATWAVPPCGTVAEFGAVDNPIPGADTVTASGAVWVKPPPVAFTVAL